MATPPTLTTLVQIAAQVQALTSAIKSDTIHEDEAQRIAAIAPAGGEEWTPEAAPIVEALQGLARTLTSTLMVSRLEVCGAP